MLPNTLLPARSSPALEGGPPARDTGFCPKTLGVAGDCTCLTRPIDGCLVPGCAVEYYQLAPLAKFDALE